jgi:hypothetical protein
MDQGVEGVVFGGREQVRAMKTVAMVGGGEDEGAGTASITLGTHI